MDFNLFIILKNIIVGLIIGFTIGMTGIGGGALIQPSLIHIIGLAPVSAVGTGLVYAMITKISAFFCHLKQKTVNARHAKYFLFGSVPGVLIASKTVNYLFNTFDKKTINMRLQMLIGIILLFTSLILTLQILYLKNYSTRDNDNHKENNSHFRKYVLSITAGFIIGVLIGATSIGSGVLIIPALILILNAKAAKAVGTSIAISLVLSTLGGIVYLLNGHINLSTTFFLLLGSLPGVFYGSKLAVKIPEKTLKVIVITIVTLSGISLLLGNNSH